MKKVLIIVPNEPLASLVQDLVKPGVEVVHLGATVDSTDIEQVVLLTAATVAGPKLMNEVALQIQGRVAKGSDLIVAFF